MKKILLAGFLIASIAATAQAPQLTWVKQMLGTAFDQGYAITVDASGNIYTTGIFNGIVDFDPGPATLNVAPVGNGDVFVTKQDAAGNLVWVRSFGGAKYEFGRAITVDASGNVYVTGYFQDTVDFDPGPGTLDLPSAGNDDIFILKLNAAGDLVYAHALGSIYNDRGYSLVLDNAGSLYIAGSFYDNVDFDPGAGVYNLNASGFNDVFILKLNAVGDFVWCKQFGGASYDEGNGVAFDAAGFVITTGLFSGTVDFDPGIAGAYLTAANTDAFVSKLDTAGDFVWAKKIGGNGGDLGTAVVCDGTGAAYVAGIFRNSADFNPDPAITYFLTSAGNADIFITKLDAAGNFVFARRMGGTADDYGLSIAIDAVKNIYTTGYYEGTADFDPGTPAFNLASAGISDIFISRLDAGGNFGWAARMGDSDDDYGNGIATDAAGNIYATGGFSEDADFEMGAVTFTLTSAGSFDTYVLKLSPDAVTTGIGMIADNTAIRIYPNPSDRFTVRVKDPKPDTVLEIYDSFGRLVYRQDQVSEFNTITLPEEKGLYLLNVASGSGVLHSEKLLKQ